LPVCSPDEVISDRPPQRKDFSMSPRKRSAARARSGELVCPECGKTFTRPASLGAHRNRAHGVAGSSKAVSARGKTARRASKSGAARPIRAKTGGARSKRAASSPKRASTQSAARPNPGGTRRVRRTSSEGQRSTVNRDGLLQSLFPTGIPAREDAIRQVNAWLDEAERLARMR
jgi:uncharacterized C2H2 Zn-finger protein